MNPLFEATLRFWEKAIIEGTIATAEIAQMSPAIRTYPIRNEHQQAGTSLASSYNANTQRFERMADALYDLRAAVELAIPAFEEVLRARAKL